MNCHLVNAAGTQSGPHSLEKVRAMWLSGELTSDMRYWCEGMAEWTSVRELEPLLQPPPSIAPVPLPLSVPAPLTGPRGWPSAGRLPPLPHNPMRTVLPAISATPEFPDVSPYYQKEFRRISESGGRYRGKWNWAAFLFGALWAFHRGLWLSGFSSIVFSVLFGAATCGIGFIPAVITYAHMFGSRGTMIYYVRRVEGRQTRFG